MLDVLSSSEELRKQYEILSVLGEGGMGIVFLGRQHGLDRKVAIKCIRCDEFGGAEAVRRFKREAQVLAGLEHPGIVKIFTVDEVGGLLFIVSEFIDGENLKQRLVRLPLRWRAGARLVADVARIIDYVHGKAIAHRDIKSENVLLPVEGGVKVIDFGLAKDYSGSSAEHNVTRKGEFLGTPEYLAPEVIRHQAIGPSCDIYSLGVVLYEVLVGRPPYRGTPFEVLTAHLKAPVPNLREALPQIPPGFDQFIARAMAKRPDERQPDAATFAAELDALVAGNSGMALERTIRTDTPLEPLPVPPVRPSSSPGRSPRAKAPPSGSSSAAGQPPLRPSTASVAAPVQRRPFVVAVVTVVLVLAVIAGAARTMRSAAPKQPENVALVSAGRGVVHVVWDSPGDVRDVEVRPKALGAAGPWRTHLADDRGTTLAGLAPGDAYELRFILRNHGHGPSRSFEAPFSAVRLVDVQKPDGPDGTVVLTFQGDEPLALVADGVQGGRRRRWDLSSEPSLRHELRFRIDDGCFGSLSVEARRSSGERFVAGLPVKDLVRQFQRLSGALQAGPYINRLVTTTLPDLGRRRLSSAERRRVVTADLLSDETVGALWSLAPLLPLVLQDEHLPVDVRLSLYGDVLKLLPFDQFGLASRSGLLFDVRRMVATFCRGDETTADQGRPIKEFSDHENSLLPNETFVVRGTSILQERQRLVGNDPLHTNLQVEFTVEAGALRDVEHHVLVVTSKQFPCQYAVRIRCNDDVDILWTEQFSDEGQLGRMFGAGKVADWGAETVTRRWTLPPVAFRPGRNVIVVTAEAPLGLDSPTMPSLVRLAWDLTRRRPSP